MKKFVSILLVVALMLTAVCALASGSGDSDAEVYDPYTEPTAVPVQHHTGDNATGGNTQVVTVKAVSTTAPEGYVEAYTMTASGEGAGKIEIKTNTEVTEVTLILVTAGVTETENNIDFSYSAGKLTVNLTAAQIEKIQAADSATLALK